MERSTHSHPRSCPYSREPPRLRQLKIPSRMLKSPPASFSLRSEAQRTPRVRLASSLAAALPAERRVPARRGWAGEKPGLFEHPAYCTPVIQDVRSSEIPANPQSVSALIGLMAAPPLPAYGTMLARPILEKGFNQMSVRPSCVSSVPWALFNVSPLFAANQPPQALLTPRRIKTARRWPRSRPARFRWVSRTETEMADAMNIHAIR